MLLNSLFAVLSVAASLLTSIVGYDVYFYIPRTYNAAWHGNATTFDPIIGWAPIKSATTLGFNYNKISSNSDGFRSAETDYQKTHIIIAGDSVAWGFGVNDEETSSSYLQNSIDPDFSHIQVLNLGVSGYGIDQYWLRLAALPPDLEIMSVVVVIYTGNDRGDTRSNSSNGKSKPLFRYVNNELSNVAGTLSKYSCFNLFSKSYFLNRFSLLRSLQDRICPPLVLNDDETTSVIRGLLENISSFAAANHAKLLFVLSPSTYDFDTSEPSGYHQYFQTLLQGLRYPYIDLYRLMKEQKVDTSKLYLDLCHYLPAGNKYLAEVIKAGIAH